jgi:outer membrane protein TolC
VEAARHAEAGAGEDHRQARRLLVQGTALAFLNALLAEESMRIARQDADFNRELSNETRKRFDVGTAAKSEVLNFDIRTTQAESRHIAAELAFRSAKTALAELLGGPAAELPADLALAPPPDAELNSPLPEFDAEWAFAQRNRPDLVSLEHATAQLRSRHAAMRAEYLPRVTLQGGTGVARADDARFNWERDNSLYAGITATWDVFSGNSTLHARTELAARGREIEAQSDRLRLAIAAELRQQLDATAVARRQLTLSEQVSRMTSEVRDLVRIEYSAGRASLTRLNEAQTDLVRASGDLASARIRCWQASENLAAVTGRNLPWSP